MYCSQRKGWPNITTDAIQSDWPVNLSIPTTILYCWIGNSGSRFSPPRSTPALMLGSRFSTSGPQSPMLLAKRFQHRRRSSRRNLACLRQHQSRGRVHAVDHRGGDQDRGATLLSGLVDDVH
jgi:hypothetical protein